MGMCHWCLGELFHFLQLFLLLFQGLTKLFPEMWHLKIEVSDLDYDPAQFKVDQRFLVT